MTNLKFGKDVHISIAVPKRRDESTSIQRETQIEEVPQSSTLQHTDESSQATKFAENDDPTPMDNDVATPTQNMAIQKRFAQPTVAHQFRHPPPFPQRF